MVSVLTREAPWRDPRLTKRLREHLKPVPTACPPGPADTTPAAVLVPLEWSSDPPSWHLYVIRRSQTVPVHRGQVAFPGGIVRPDDDGPWNTACREAWEEVGLPPDFLEPLGSLPPIRTITNFWVCPIVATVRHPWKARLDRREVAALLRIPLAYLMDPDHHRWLEIRRGRDVYRGHAFWYGPDLIWGATARMIIAFLDAVTMAYGG